MAKQPESLAEWLMSLPAAEADAFKDAQLILPWSELDESTTAMTGVWLGGHWITKDADMLKSRGVTHILALNGTKPYFLLTKFKVKVVELDDMEGQQLAPVFSDCFAFVDEARRQRSGVLVHCTAGKSRSVAIVIAYLMRNGRCSGYDEALALVQTKRPWACPNPSFARQLRAFAPRQGGPLPGADTPSDVGRGAGGSGCELCHLERRTEWLDTSNPKFVVLECDQCDMPMAVWRAHTMTISDADAADMERALRTQADRVIGEGKYYVDKRQRSIFTHLHWHARRGFDWKGLFESKL